MLKVVFLGTSAAVPTPQRNTSCIYLEYDFDIRFLWDIGECCQKRLMENKLKFMRINHIFITHWHADHFAGLMGLIHTMSLEGRTKALTIYGPRRSKEFVERILNTGYYARNFPIDVKELNHEEVVEFEHFTIKAFRTHHRVPSLGYVFEEKPRLKANMEKAKAFGLKTGPLIGKLKRGETITFKGKTIKPEDVIEEVPGIKVVYTGDTKYTTEIIEHAKNADLLIAEATISSEDYDENIYHLTNEDAAQIAAQAKVKKLILTHISRRYTPDEEKMQKFLEKAKNIFHNTEVAEENQVVVIKK